MIKRAAGLLIPLLFFFCFGVFLRFLFFEPDRPGNPESGQEYNISAD